MKDNLAVFFSGLCLIHCLLTPLLLLFGLADSVVSLFTSEQIHWFLLIPVAGLAVLSLPFSWIHHQSYKPMVLASNGISLMVLSLFMPEKYELWLTIPAAWLVISAHLLNKWLLIKLSINTSSVAME